MEKALSAMERSFHDSGSGSHTTEGEGKNPCIQRVWPEWSDDLAHEVEALATRIIEAPILLSHGMLILRVITWI